MLSWQYALIDKKNESWIATKIHPKSNNVVILFNIQLQTIKEICHEVCIYFSFHYSSPIIIIMIVYTALNMVWCVCFSFCPIILFFFILMTTFFSSSFTFPNSVWSWIELTRTVPVLKCELDISTYKRDLFSLPFHHYIPFSYHFFNFSLFIYFLTHFFCILFFLLVYHCHLFSWISSEKH